MGTYDHLYRSDGAFAVIPLDLLKDPDADAYIIASYAALRSFADYGKETGARVSDTTAAERAGMSARKFRECRKWLAGYRKTTRGTWSKKPTGPQWISWITRRKAKGVVNEYIVRSVGVRHTVPGGAAHGAVGVRHTVPTTDSQLPISNTNVLVPDEPEKPIDDVIARCNRVREAEGLRPLRPLNGHRQKIGARLREFTADELVGGFRAAAANPWVRERLSERLHPTHVFRNDANLERYVEAWRDGEDGGGMTNLQGVTW